MLGLNRTGTHESIAALVDFTRAVLSSIRRYRWLGSSFYVLQSALTVLAALAVDCPAFQTLVGWRPALWPRLLVDVCGHPLSRIREFTGVPGLSLRRDYAISMNVESYMATMRGQSMGGVSSRVMISPNGARLTGSSTNALMPRMWLAGSMLRWYLTYMGICWSPTLNTKSNSDSGSRVLAGIRSVSKFRMTDAVASTTFLAR